MDLGTAELHKHTFRLHGKPLTFVETRSQQAALEFLNETYSHDHGFGLLEGPRLIGKTTIIQRFLQDLSPATAVAYIDCKNINTSGFFGTILKQFGYELNNASVNEQLNMLKVFLVQQTSINHAPLLLVENAPEMSPVVYHAFSQLITARYYGQSAVRVVLVGAPNLELVDSNSIMNSVAKHKSGQFAVGPMIESEIGGYLDRKLRAGGCEHPEAIVTAQLCKEIFEESKGNPGQVDRLMLLRFNETDELPLKCKFQRDSVLADSSEPFTEDMVEPREMLSESPDAPQLYITLNGATLQEVRLNQSRFLIGRSDANDISINSPLVSRHHALLTRQNGATVLTDLNSTNGVFVNSKQIVSQVLRHNDIISVGDHGIKMIDINSRYQTDVEAPTLDDTTTMKVLADMRRVKAKKRMYAVQRAVSH